MTKAEKIVEFYGSTLIRLFNRGLELTAKVSERNDNITVWIVGMEVAAIGLIITKPDVLTSNYSKLQLTVVVGLFFISLLLGVISRIFLALADHFNIRVFIAMEGAAISYNSPRIPLKLKEDSIVEAIIECLDKDLGWDVEFIKQKHNSIQDKEAHRRLLLKVCNSEIDNLNEIIAECTKQYNRVLQHTYGYTDKEMIKVTNQYKGIGNVGRTVRRLNKWGFYTYGIFLSAFILAILSMIVFYLKSF